MVNVAVPSMRAPPPCETESNDVTFQRGAGGKVQERFKFKNAHISVCHIFADFTVVEVCDGAAEDEDATTVLPKKRARNVPAGRWKKLPGKFKR